MQPVPTCARSFCLRQSSSKIKVLLTLGSTLYHGARDGFRSDRTRGGLRVVHERSPGILSGYRLFQGLVAQSVGDSGGAAALGNSPGHNYPAYQTENTHLEKSGWTDQTFLLKYRIITHTFGLAL